MKKLLLLLIIPFLMVGCSDDDVADDEIDLIGEGTHQFELSGFVDRASSGEAQFLHGKDKSESTGPQSILTVNFYSDDEEVLINFAIVVPGDVTGVKEGTYTIVAPDDINQDETWINFGMLGPKILIGMSGTVTISEIREFTVKGSVNVTVGNGLDDTENTTISGDFTAKGITETLN